MACLIVAGAALWLTALTALPALSEPVVLPVERGVPFRLAFVTSVTTDATSGDIEFYNDFVNDAANAVSELAIFGFSWNAIVSTTLIDARSNTSTKPSFAVGGALGIPIYLLDGTKLADSNDDLWDGTLDTLFDVAEDGSKITSGTTIVGTGTRFDGTLFAGRPNGGSFPEIGSILSAGASWIQLDSSLPATQRRIYALSDTIIFSIPAPSSLAVSILGLAALAAARRLSNRRN